MTSNNEPTNNPSENRDMTAVPPFLILLRITEYHTLLRKGMLHAVPAERIVHGAAIEEYSVWTDAFQATDVATEWVLLPSFSGITPLDINQVDVNQVYAVSEQEAKAIQTREGGLTNSSFPTWLQGVWDAIKRARWLLSNFPHGVLVVPRSGRERPEQARALAYSAGSYLSPARLGDPAAWSAALPDMEDDEYAVILPLGRPVVPSPLPKEYLNGEVMPISERGRTLLIEHAGYSASMLASPNFQKIIPEVLANRRIAESEANGNRLASAVTLKPAYSGQFEKLKPAVRAAVKNRFRIEAGEVANTIEFWDYLLAYDRTGEHADNAQNNSRGFLYDIYAVSRQYLDARKNRGELTDTARSEIREGFGVWSTMVNDPSLNDTAYKAVVPTSKSANTVKIARLNAHLNSQKENVFAAAYLYLELRRFMGDNEGDFSARHLETHIKFATANGLELELALALYAIGAYLPASRFMDIYRTAPRLLPAAPLKSVAKPRKVKGGISEQPQPVQAAPVDEIISGPQAAYQQDTSESVRQLEMELKPSADMRNIQRIDD